MPYIKPNKKKYEGPSKEDRLKEFAQKMADMVLDNLKSQNAVYSAGWEGGEDGLPFSLIRGTNYSGTNMWMLLLTGADAKYSSNAWLTFKDAQNEGGHVKAGEHGTSIMRVIWKDEIVIKKDKDGNPELDAKGKPQMVRASKFGGVKFFTVFNYDQCEGLKPLEEYSSYKARKRNHHIPEDSYMAVAEEMCDNAFVPVEWRGVEAYYRPSKDLVVLPDKDRFLSGFRCFGTAAHELSHASGAESRLNRDLKHRFASSAYAFEELIAEFSASMLCAMLGGSKEIEESSVAYLTNWAEVIKKDPAVLIYDVLPQATKACAYVSEHCDLEKILEKHGFNTETGVDDTGVAEDSGHSL